MRTINRTAITIIPKQPYIDWANNVEDSAGYDKNYVTTILIPDKYDEFNYETYMKKIYKKIIVEEFESWMTDQDDWPADMIWDYGDGDIEHDD